jgi:hypothetical protein
MVYVILLLCTLATANCESRLERAVPNARAQETCELEGKRIYDDMAPEDERRVVCRIIRYPV